MPPHSHRPAALAWQVFRGSAAVRHRLLTPHQLRGSAWVRLRHDVYADARLDRDHRLACRAAVLRLPPEAVIAGPSAAYLLGVEHAARFTDDVHVIVPRKVRAGPQQGMRVHSLDLEPLDIITLGLAPGPSVADASPLSAAPTPPWLDERASALTRTGIPPWSDARASALTRTDVARTAWDVAIWLDIPVAVSIIDTLIGNCLLTAADLRPVLDRYADRPGCRRARVAFDLADGRAQSPPESLLRVRLVLAGLPRPVAQHAVVLPSGLTLHPGLAWPEFKVAVEYDGHWHADADADQLHHDRQRLNQLVGNGWLVLHVTSRRLNREFPGVLRDVRNAPRLRGWRPRRP